MWQYNYTDELYHYGVLGMKWGVRKGRSLGTRNKSGSIRPKTFLNKKNSWKATEKHWKN